MTVHCHRGQNIYQWRRDSDKCPRRRATLVLRTGTGARRFRGPRRENKSRSTMRAQAPLRGWQPSNGVFSSSFQSSSAAVSIPGLLGKAPVSGSRECEDV